MNEGNKTAGTRVSMNEGQNVFPTQRQFILLISIYFAAHALIRVLVSQNVELDEGEQLILTQELAWGYRTQPPLYTWLQALFFSLLGTNIAALSLLKHLLLLITYTFIYKSALLITRHHLRSMVACGSLLFLPQISWESHRDLTHSVLSTSIASVTWYVVLRLIETQRTIYYSLAGLCAGLGILAKYNFAVLVGALVCAGAFSARIRPAFQDRRMVLSVIILFLVLLPHGVWALNHSQVLFSDAAQFDLSKKTHFLIARITGLADLFFSMITFSAPLIAFYVLILRRKFISALRSWRDPSAAELFVKTAWFTAVLLSLAVLMVGVANFKERWFQPILIFLPLLLITLTHKNLEDRKLKHLLVAEAALACVVLIGMAGHTAVLSSVKGSSRLSAPLKQLFSGVVIEPGTENILAENRWLAGNLRLFYPQFRIFSSELPAPTLAGKSGKAVLVWNATINDNPPDALMKAFQSRGIQILSNSKPAYVQEAVDERTKKRIRLGILNITIQPRF